MKIVLIGGGSYVFAPSVVEDLMVKAKLSDFEFVLMDIDKEAAQVLAKIAQRVAVDNALNVIVSATSNRLKALENADYVITSVAIQGAKRWLMDYEICMQEGIPFELRESGALAGIIYGFRAITLLMDICRDMEKVCPNAKLLNVSNPLTKVHEAIYRFSGIEAYGFCNVAQRGAEGYEHIARLLGMHHTELEVVSAGLNHFSWITKITDKKTGRSMLSDYAEKYFQMNTNESNVVYEWYKKFNAIIAPPIDHASDFLPYQPNIHYVDTPPFHGSESERIQRTEDMLKMADGTVDYQTAGFFSNGSWEHPGLVAATLHTKGSMHIPVLNLPNKGCIPQLPTDAIVEVPVDIVDGVMSPYTNIVLPDAVVDYMQNQCLINRLVAEAAVEGDIEKAFDIIKEDNAITHKVAAAKALKKMLTVHADILPQFTHK